MSLFVTAQQFARLQERYQTWEAAGFPPNEMGCPVDPLLPEVLRKVNRLPGVVSVYACEGHAEYELHYTGVRRGRSAPFYLRCAVLPEGMETMARIYMQLHERYMTMFHQRLAPGVTKLEYLMGTAFWPDTDEKIPYPYVQLDARTDSSSRKQVFFSNLHAVLDAELKLHGIVSK